MTRFALVLTLVTLSGCAAKELLQKPSEPGAAPANLAAEKEVAPEPEQQESVEASCSTPECEEACLAAGDLAAQCAAAFAAGCFSDVPPEGEPACAWREGADEEAESSRAAESAPQRKMKKKADGAAEDVAAPVEDSTPKVRPVDVAD